MKSLQQSIEIKGNVSTVFEALADPNIQMKYDGEMMRSCEKLSEGPIGRGSHFRGNFRGMGKVKYEYSDFRLNSVIEHSVRMPFGPLHHRFKFETVDGGTILTQIINIEPNFLGKIIWPFIIKSMMTKRMDTLNALLKQYIESQK